MRTAIRCLEEPTANVACCFVLNPCVAILHPSSLVSMAESFSSQAGAAASHMYVQRAVLCSREKKGVIKGGGQCCDTASLAIMHLRLPEGRC